MKKNIFKISALSALAVTGVVTPIIAFATSCNKPPVVTDDYVETVTKANELISSKTFNTMSSMLEFLEENNIDLQTKTVSSSNAQYVWDKPQNKIFLLKSDGTVFHKPEGFTPSENKAFIWKMVKAKSPSKLFSSKSNASIYADQFDETTQYSQYLRDGEAFSGKSLSFCSGLDTGSHEKLQLTFNKAESESQEPVVINTMKSSLEVKGSWSDVNHYGNLTELTVETLDEKNKKSYNEYGSVDAAIVVKKGTISTKEGADVNSIVVDTTNVNDVRINIGANESVGSIGATKTQVAAELNKIIKVDESVTKIPEVETTKETPVPLESAEFYSGTGSEKSPWTIKTATQLKNFATKVASQTTSTKYYFNLIADINMKDEGEWTPVGTTSLPFKGIFNGCGFTITNLKIKAQSNGFMGLFGYTDGEINTTFNSASRTSIWDETNQEIKKQFFTQETYKTQILNLSLDKVSSEAGTTTSTKEVGSVVGRSQNTYFSNIHVNSGRVYGNKVVGGLAGTAHGCIFENCTTGSKSGNNLEVVARSRNVGGMVGGCAYDTKIDTSEAFIECINYASVQQNNENGEIGGYAGGLVGICQEDVRDQQTGEVLHGYTVFEDCANFGSVHSTCGSAFGIAQAKRTWIFNRCINNGAINNVNLYTPTYPSTDSCLAGIGIYGTAKCFKCHNYGVISGASLTMAGILADATSGGLDNPGLDSCSSDRKLLQPTYGNCNTATLASGQITLILKNETFANVNELNNAISSFIGQEVSIELQNVTVTNKSGTLSIPSNLRSITSDKEIATDIDIKTDDGYITIDVPKINVNVKASCPNAYIVNFSDNSTLTVAQGGTCLMAGVSGVNSQVINNGTVTSSISIDGDATYGENNGTCGGVNFGTNSLGWGRGSKKFINNNTIKRTATGNNQHVLCSIGGSACSIEIHNKGTIEYDTTSNNYRAYLMCLYTTGTIVFKTYENSSFITNDPENRTVAPVRTHMDIYYKPGENGAIFKVKGVKTEWTTLRQSNVVVKTF